MQSLAATGTAVETADPLARPPRRQTDRDRRGLSATPRRDDRSSRHQVHSPLASRAVFNLVWRRLKAQQHFHTQRSEKIQELSSGDRLGVPFDICEAGLANSQSFGELSLGEPSRLT